MSDFTKYIPEDVTKYFPEVEESKCLECERLETRIEELQAENIALLKRGDKWKEKYKVLKSRGK